MLQTSPSNQLELLRQFLNDHGRFHNEDPWDMTTSGDVVGKVLRHGTTIIRDQGELVRIAPLEYR